jgi:hypothetical protein
MAVGLQQVTQELASLTSLEKPELRQFEAANR